EAIEILNKESDIAVALIDVVMEDDKAGLNLIKYIREAQKNNLIRLVLRTGQPGQAPEKQVIREYDINDYKEKTELTAQKLYSTIYTSIRSYRDMLAVDNNRRGLEHIIHASSQLFTTPVPNEFIQGMLEQLVALLYLDDDAFFLKCGSVAYEFEKGEPVIVAATGRFVSLIGKNPINVLDKHVFSLVKEAHHLKHPIIHDKEFVAFFQTHDGREDVIYITSNTSLNDSDIKLIEIFLHNVCIAYENVILQNEIEGTQRDMLYTLGESIETRSKETGQHVRRVSEYSRLITLGLGLPESEAEIIAIAAPLHDFGKIGIPDNILNKPGALNDDEWEIMKSHAQIGETLLSNSNRKILKAASIIAGQHHEHWNGNGYPRQLKAKEIHIYGRIAAIADVFDALGTKRCYKDAWPMDKIIDYFREQRDKQFDPEIVDWVLDNLDVMNEVRLRFPD
ncbi:MAG: DUF3369 domain-containing protein, partial [Gammaproteobacteria bacterium]|nr:DUF3369 domain-containing protein [Gammaproteobacteria bacterium]